MATGSGGRGLEGVNEGADGSLSEASSASRNLSPVNAGNEGAKVRRDAVL